MESIGRVLSRMNVYERFAEFDRINRMTLNERYAEFYRIYKEQQNLDPDGPDAEKYKKNALTLEMIAKTIPSI